MCIIIYMPKGQQLPKEHLRNAIENNPDGVGIMWKTADNTVNYEKGVFTYAETLAKLEALDPNTERAIHCRIATSGVVSAACCHPFPVTKDLKVMAQATNVRRARSLVMHNGVIPFCTPQGGLKAPYSDTMIFTRDFLCPLEESLGKKAIQTLIAEATTSRLLVFSKKHDPLLVGDWLEEGGIYYSNSSYKPYIFTPIHTKAWSYEDYYQLSGKGTDTYHLYFNFEAMTQTEALDTMDDILDELCELGCYPDTMEADDTSLFLHHIMSFETTVIKLPPTNKVLGYYDYEIIQNESEELSNVNNKD